MPGCQKLLRTVVLRPEVRLPLALLVSLVLLSLAACGGSSTTPAPTAAPAPSATPPPVSPPASVSLPEDKGGHDAGIEWWYFNGHLTDDSGRRYSFHFVTFQSAAGPGTTAQLLQLSWSDHARGLYLTEEKAGLTATAPSPGRFDVQNAGWSMRGDGVDYALSFDTEGHSAGLTATSRKPAALHQGTGLVRLGPAGYTYYYSRTRLDVSGMLAIDGQPREVTGTAWMDHQWGDVTSQRVGWDWMSLQFDDGSELMAALVWDPDGHLDQPGLGGGLSHGMGIQRWLAGAGPGLDAGAAERRVLRQPLRTGRLQGRGGVGGGDRGRKSNHRQRVCGAGRRRSPADPIYPFTTWIGTRPRSPTAPHSPLSTCQGGIIILTPPTQCSVGAAL